MTGKGGRKKKNLGRIMRWKLPIALSFDVIVNPSALRSD